MPDLRKSFLVLVLFGLLAITACGVGAKPIPTLSHDFTTSTPAANYPTAMPTFTPTPAVLGSLENPIVIAMVNSSPSAEQQTAFNDLASLLGGQLQMTVIGRFYNTYQELEFALQRQQVHFAWLQPSSICLLLKRVLPPLSSSATTWVSQVMVCNSWGTVTASLPLTSTSALTAPLRMRELLSLSFPGCAAASPRIIR